MAANAFNLELVMYARREKPFRLAMTGYALVISRNRGSVWVVMKRFSCQQEYCKDELETPHRPDILLLERLSGNRPVGNA